MNSQIKMILDENPEWLENGGCVQYKNIYTNEYYFGPVNKPWTNIGGNKFLPVFPKNKFTKKLNYILAESVNAICLFRLNSAKKAERVRNDLGIAAELFFEMHSNKDAQQKAQRRQS